jgi:hypothetical protein
MVKITLSISEDLQSFIEYQTIKEGFHSTDDYLCNLLKGERDRERLEGILREGLESGIYNLLLVGCVLILLD